jgi:iron only hydrogenase large subunit-like protein
MYKAVKNADFQETTYKSVESGADVKFGVANGFRNIQNLVQKLKRGKGSDFHLVEVMACPAGCLNGGAQARPEETEQSGAGSVAQKEMLARFVCQVYSLQGPINRYFQGLQILLRVFFLITH